MSYIPHTDEEIREMLDVIGARGIEDLFKSIPNGLRSKKDIDLPAQMNEQSLSLHMGRIAAKNRSPSQMSSFLGAGAYRHYIPAAVSELASRSEFVTPYTPYQPEISQGTLQTLFEYQSQICRLFEMDVSNASHYSGATACADAALMAKRIARGRGAIVVPDGLHPEYREVLATALGDGDGLRTIPSPKGCIDRDALGKGLDRNTAAAIVQYPNFFGIVEDLGGIAKAIHDVGALLIVAVPEPIALGILKTPGAFGADIAVGEGLSLGLSTSFGGPGFGIFTVRSEYVRQMPGRVAGRTVDAQGRTGYVLTLSTREQHIRREKATSNICTNQALCATQAAIYLAMLGKEGIRELASVNASKAAYALKKLTAVQNVRRRFDAPAFNEFVVECPCPAKDVLEGLAARDIYGGVDLGRWYPGLSNCILVCATELNTRGEIDRYAEVLGEIVHR